MIARGLYHLMQSTAGDEASEYHLQAGIAACHCAAQNYESTDWPRILSLYDRLIELDDSPVVALNRAVAVAHVHGPRAGIKAVEAIHDHQQLNCYYLLYAVLGEFEADLDHRQAAMKHFRKALELATMKSETHLPNQENSRAKRHRRQRSPPRQRGALTKQLNCARFVHETVPQSNNGTSTVCRRLPSDKVADPTFFLRIFHISPPAGF
jgi:hypothetical protein